ncbi:MAG: glgA 3 [Firmicutes bacterium]|nr:glgA 3 [Bacillota bacterium]
MTAVLFAAAEAAPFIKTGGLGDVVGSLPKELNKQGMEVRTILPLYSDIAEEWRRQMRFLGQNMVKLGWREQYAGLFMLEMDGQKYYFIDNEYYFKRQGIYGFSDDDERFAFFCRAVLEAFEYLEFFPDIIHCHDWHTGVLPVLLAAHYRHKAGYERLRTVLTIHNICYQGIFPKAVLSDILELDETEYFSSDKLGFYGAVNYLQAGLAFADVLTTVSPTYLAEIVTPEGGCRLDGALNLRRGNTYSILNGIDYEVYNPSADKAIYVEYSQNSIERKMSNKMELQQYLGMTVDPDIPLVGVVSRLVADKGMDLIIEGLDELIGLGVAVVILGTGEKRYEDFLLGAAKQYEGKLSVNIFFDNVLAHRIYAGADLYLMPSLSEPCGLSQMIALRYGCVPVVRATGGLADTIMPYGEYTGEGNGFSFTEYTKEAMVKAVNRALALRSDSNAWRKLVMTAMQADNSWRRSAAEYSSVYDRLLLAGVGYVNGEGGFQTGVYRAAEDSSW